MTEKTTTTTDEADQETRGDGDDRDARVADLIRAARLAPPAAAVQYLTDALSIAFGVDAEEASDATPFALNQEV